MMILFRYSLKYSIYIYHYTRVSACIIILFSLYKYSLPVHTCKGNPRLTYTKQVVLKACIVNKRVKVQGCITYVYM